MIRFPQGIIGDPGFTGRDGDPGIEVLYAADIDILIIYCIVFLSVIVSAQAYQGPQGLSGNFGLSGAEVTC